MKFTDPRLLFISLDRKWAVCREPRGPTYLIHRSTKHSQWFGVTFLNSVEHALEFIP